MIITNQVIAKCNHEALKPVLARLQQYGAYCKLLTGDLTTYVSTFEQVGKMPEQLKQWLKLFDGGLLFTVSMFSTRQQAKDSFSRILTFAEINSPEFKKQNGIPEEIVCFAMTNYGNYYCYVTGETGEAVYEFDTNENALILKWDSFAQWLDEQIDFSESLIRDELIEPVED